MIFFALALGDDLSGKTTLAAKLQGVEDPVRGAGLEYQFMEVEDDDNDGGLMVCV